jgi:signal transduction histidine kinase
MRNAVEHTADGTPVAIGSRIEAGQALIWVRDEGPGIDEAAQARLFERFARGKAGARTTAGAGLGLAIVKAIVDAHGGQIRVDSNPDRGATFTLAFPTDPPKDVAP